MPSLDKTQGFWTAGCSALDAEMGKLIPVCFPRQGKSIGEQKANVKLGC